MINNEGSLAPLNLARYYALIDVAGRFMGITHTAEPPEHAIPVSQEFADYMSQHPEYIDDVVVDLDRRTVSAPHAPTPAVNQESNAPRQSRGISDFFEPYPYQSAVRDELAKLPERHEIDYPIQTNSTK